MHPDASNCETAGALRFPRLESLSALAKAIDYGPRLGSALQTFFAPPNRFGALKSGFFVAITSDLHLLVLKSLSVRFPHARTHKLRRLEGFSATFLTSRFQLTVGHVEVFRLAVRTKISVRPLSPIGKPDGRTSFSNGTQQSCSLNTTRQEPL
jgi:hypothetical protein